MKRISSQLRVLIQITEIVIQPLSREYHVDIVLSSMHFAKREDPRLITTSFVNIYKHKLREVINDFN